MHIFTLYFLDSGDYQARALPWSTPDYDYIKQSQIDWFLNTSSHIQPIERPFQPDGTKDLGHVWQRRSTRSSRQSADRFLAKPNAIMWFHIPLPEAYDAADKDTTDGGDLDVGDQLDGEGSSKHNGGFFNKGIKQAFAESSSASSAMQTAEVKVLSHGHCHVTDRCRRVDGIWCALENVQLTTGCALMGVRPTPGTASWDSTDGFGFIRFRTMGRLLRPTRG